MNYALKLSIPVFIGIAAAVINLMILTSGTRKVQFVTVTQPLRVGERFNLEQAEPLEVPATFENLSRTMVPFEDRGVLSGRIVRRPIEAGDPIFFADTDLSGQWFDLQPNEELFPISLDEVNVDPQLLRIGNYIRFRVPAIEGESEAPWIGPFRIVAVGAKISNNFSEGPGSGGSSNIGIAFDEKQDSEQTKRLELFCDEQRKGTALLLGVRIIDTR